MSKLVFQFFRWGLFSKDTDLSKIKGIDSCLMYYERKAWSFDDNVAGFVGKSMRRGIAIFLLIFPGKAKAVWFFGRSYRLNRDEPSSSGPA